MRRARALAALLTVSALNAGPARAGPEPLRFVVAIGNNIGAPDQTTLRFAEADASRVAQLFRELGGSDSERVLLLTDRTADQIRAALRALERAIRAASAIGRSAELVIYFSGHARDDVLQLAGSRLPLRELVRMARRTGSGTRVLILDACDVDVGATRGAAPTRAHEVALASGGVRGEVIITSSGPLERSEEWDSLSGGLFTHHLLAGLRGDADHDRDGRVTLSEAYDYAYGRTVASAAMGAQRPSFAMSVSGAGQLVLSEPGRGAAAVVLPAEAEGEFVIVSQPRPTVVVSVSKAVGEARRVALPRGRYLVKKKAGARVWVTEVELLLGGAVILDQRALQLRSFDELARGRGSSSPARRLLAVAALESESLARTGPRLLAGLSYAVGLEALRLSVSASAGAAHFQAVQLETSERTLRLAVGVALRWELTSALELFAGVELDGRWVRQEFQRDAEDELAEVLGVARLPPRQALGALVGPLLGVELILPYSMSMLVQLQGQVRAIPTRRAPPPPLLGAQGQVGLGVRL